MKIRLVGGCINRADGPQFAASYLIGDSVAIDAGSIGLMSSVDDQRKIKHVFISHSHLDHIASLPMFLDNVYQMGPDCPQIYGNASLRESLLRDVFNDRLWPDLIRISQEESAFLRFHHIESHQTVAINGLRITAIDVDHLVPTLGFIVEDQDTAVAIVSDTSPTEKIWQVARSKQNLKAVFLEAAFPNRMAWLAEKSAHLTPELFGREFCKLGKQVPVIAVHIKPAFHDEVLVDLRALELTTLQIGESNCDYEFS